ncbi:hypothetical protein [Crateriforma spongiae]|uniref:hypothetical protein n=1 Tax=Crateriforma spongiae TaxID=2724528 RepID=UPI00197F1A0A|nr:hypothetical protein [Crateriforma spongiae]
MTAAPNPYEPPETASSSAAGNVSSVRRLQSLACLIVLGSAIATGLLIAIANLGPDDSSEDRRTVFVFFVGLAVVFGTAGSYLSSRYIAGNIPLYFITVALGVFVVAPFVVGVPNYTHAFVLLGLIAAVSVVASLVTAWQFRRMLA